MSIHPALPRRVLRALPAAALWLALVAILAACSGAAPGQGVVSLTDPSASPDRTDGSTDPSASLDPEEAMLAFQDCMREHGIDLQVAFAPISGGSTGGGRVGVKIDEGPSTGGAAPAQPGTAISIDREKLGAAQEACGDLLPTGGRGDPGPTMDPELKDQLLEFAQCMRDHGVDVPDPQFDGARVTIGWGSGQGGDRPDPNSKTFQTAQEACGDAVPGGGMFRVGTAPGSASEIKP